MDIDFRIGKLIIETNRLILRGWQVSDLEDFFEFAGVEGVGEYAGLTHHESIETTKTVLDQFIKQDHVFAIEYKKNNKVIGSLGVGSACADEKHENLITKGIGFMLSRDYWGHGIMTEAVKAVIDWLFKYTDIEMLVCGYFEGNDRSRRVIEKCGFEFIGEEIIKQIGEKRLGKNYIKLKSE